MPIVAMQRTSDEATVEQQYDRQLGLWWSDVQDQVKEETISRDLTKQKRKLIPQVRWWIFKRPIGD